MLIQQAVNDKNMDDFIQKIEGVMELGDLLISRTNQMIIKSTTKANYEPCLLTVDMAEVSLSPFLQVIKYSGVEDLSLVLTSSTGITEKTFFVVFF